MDPVRFRRAVRCAFVLFVSGVVVAGLAPGSAFAATAPRFVVPDPSPTGELPLDVMTGDFNGDGLTDAVVANDGPASVFRGGIAVLPGDGAGRLGQPIVTQLPDDLGARDLAVADFDGDGNLDVAAVGSTTGGPGSIFSLLGNGDGTFSVAEQISNLQEGKLVAADFSGDEIPDLAFGTRAGRLKVFRGNGDGTFGPQRSLVTPFGTYDLVAADVDGDGDVDVVGAGGGPPWTELNFGNGIFAGIWSNSLSGIAVTLADFDGDGVLDAATGNASEGTVYVGHGNADGSFSRITVLRDVASQVTGVTSGDVDGDGRPDLVANGDGGTSVLFRRNASGRFEPPTRWVTGSMDPTAVDLNGDDRSDLVAFESGTVYASPSTGTGFRAPSVIPSTGAGIMRTADMNGDGKPDIVSAAPAVIGPGTIVSGVHVQLGLGGGRFAAPITTKLRDETASSGIQAIRVADVNEDGKPDVVGGFDNFLPNPSNLVVALGHGDGHFGPISLFDNGDTSADVDSLDVADVNGDHHVDIVSHTLAQVTVKLGNGDGTFGAPIDSSTSGAGEKVTEVADVTGDGIPDVVNCVVTGGPDVSSSDVNVHRGNGDGTFALVQTVSNDTNCTNGAAADFNGDGRPDMAVIGNGGSNGGRFGLYVMLNTGGQLGPFTYYPYGSGSLAVADFNGDGALDLATDALRVDVNAGNGTFPLSNLYLAPASVGTTGDFTGDGKPDIVTGGPAGGIALYVNVTS
jgi:hypothetical protein